MAMFQSGYAVHWCGLQSKNVCGHYISLKELEQSFCIVMSSHQKYENCSGSVVFIAMCSQVMQYFGVGYKLQHRNVYGQY